MASGVLRSSWLTGFSIAAVLSVALAGLRGIVVARRIADDETERAFRDETAGRARALETRLSAIRSDLAFVAVSSPLAQLRESSGPGDWRRVGAEGALLLFLRGHPEVVRVVARSPAGKPLLHTGRRGGIPVLWVSSSPTGLEGAAVAPGRPRLTASFALGAGEGPTREEPTLETEVEASVLLSGAEPEDGRVCALSDAAGTQLARHPAGRRPVVPAEAILRAADDVAADGWSAPGPWRLECEQPGGLALGRGEPMAARYRTTLTLNLAATGLALLLGGLVVHLARRREWLEAQAREETRVRELERQLFHAERLTTVGRLAAGIAHEINNPLEGMANWLSLARGELAQGRADAAAEHLARVKEGLDRAAAIVRQVLAQSDPAKASRVPVDLNQILRETEQFVQSRKEFAAIAFGLDLVAGPLLVQGSPVMLGQVAVNLIVNACEAQPQGGEVRVSSRREGGHVLAQIADRGPGIAEAERARIFEPFYSTKDSTGLGLSICDSIVRQHEGELSISAREGGGALFQVKLPALEAS